MSSVFLDTIVWRNNRLEVLCEKDALRNFAKFTVKHQCQWLFLNKVVDLRPANILKKSLCMRLLRGSFLQSLEDVSPQHKLCDCADQFNVKMSTVHSCTRLFLLFSLNICTTSSHFSAVLLLMFLCFLSVSLPHLTQLVGWVQIWKKTFCENSQKFDYIYI